ncbi:MAG: hypothetical protein JO277_02490 [Candidatus Eremiobacteraeota bacterium]|nr:hypothetical protein [Candidatus Eremiobacteraeota bacterium]
MIRWLRRLFYRRRPAPSGPRHLFVEMHDEPLKYLGEVASPNEMTERAEIYMAQRVLRSGDVLICNYYAAAEPLDSKERAAIEREKPAVH